MDGDGTGQREGESALVTVVIVASVAHVNGRTECNPKQ